MSEFKVMSLAEIEDEAHDLGCSVVVAKDNELQFDLDTLESESRFSEFYEQQLVNRYGDRRNRSLIFSPVNKVEWTSRSGNKHVVVQLPVSLGVPERIALQLAGGSDYKREFASLCCHMDGSSNPILLFKPNSPVELKVIRLLESEEVLFE